MNKLTKYAFADLYAMASGISTTKEQAGHGSPFISFSTVFNNYFLPDTLPDLMDTSLKEQETYSIKKGDILVTRTSETIDELAMSCVAVKDYPCATYSGFTKRLRPLTTGIAYDKYLAFYLRGYLFRKAVTNNAFMTLRASFNEDIFSFLNLYLPDYQEQVKTGDMLYNMEQKIQLNKQICAELEAMAKTLYDYWFVQFDFPDDNDCPYKSSGGNMVWNDRLKREIPQGWNVDNILSICEIKVGGTPSKFNNTYWDNGSIPFFGPTDVSDNIFQLDTVDHITHEGLEHCASSLFQVGDIILTARGSIGKMVIVGEPMAMNQSCYALSPKFQNTTYLYFLSKELIEWLKAKGNGSVFKSFNVQDVEYSQLCIAPTQIIERFCNSVNCLFSQIRENTKEIATLIAQRKELLPLLMNGQVSIMPQEVNCDLS